MQRVLLVGCLIVGVGMVRSQDYQDYQEHTKDGSPSPASKCRSCPCGSSSGRSSGHPQADQQVGTNIFVM